MRVFIAIEFDEEIKDYLYSKQQEVIGLCEKGNFSRRENFHLTLKFIGEAEQSDVLKLKEAINSTANEAKPFVVKLSDIGCFDKGNRKIVWVGTKQSNELSNLYEKLQTELNKAGYPSLEKGYNPHITIGREVRTDFFERIKGIDIEPKEIRVTKISLMESTRLNGVLVYQPISGTQFRGQASINRDKFV